ncbi:MAG: hypothetical protein HQL63_07870 [Magnetococcales bacterium]|nr:hypothetical protein [Magnetococcales bacterium]MBF0321911.1 hypothetical protein [Magnetococcales bacterium]
MLPIAQSMLNVKFPKKHNLEELAKIIRESGAMIPEEFEPLLGYSECASTFRYDPYPESQPEPERDHAVILSGHLLRHVESLLAKS